MKKNLKKELERFKLLLTDLSKKNKALRLLRLTRRNHVDMVVLSKINPKLPSEVLSKVLARKNTNLYEYGTLIDDEVEEITSGLRGIFSTGNSQEQETGAYDLYYGYPFIEGQFNGEDQYYRCPLMLFPVRLEAQSEGKPILKLKPDESRPVILNTTFLLGYQKYNEVPIDLSFITSEEKRDEVPLENPVEWAIKKVNDLGIKITNVSDWQVSPKLEKFPEYRKNELPKDMRGKNFLRPYAVLGFFPQADTALLLDYEDILKRKDEAVFQDILDEPEEEEKTDKPRLLIDTIDVEGTQSKEFPTFTETDESQEQVILAARESKKLVIHGPPGTGKSQVIVNIILDHINRDKSVLMVCQKKTALDVVYQRIAELGLSDYLMLVHDPVRDRKGIYDKVEKVHNAHTNERLANKEGYERLCGEIDNLTKEVNSYAKELYSKTEFGLTIRELYLKSKDTKPVFENEELSKLVSFQDLSQLIKEIDRVGDSYNRFNDKNFLISKRKSFSQTKDADRIKMVKSLKILKEKANELSVLWNNEKALGSTVSKLLGTPQEEDPTDSLYQTQKKQTQDTPLDILHKISWSRKKYKSRGKSIIRIFSTGYWSARSFLTKLYKLNGWDFESQKEEIKDSDLHNQKGASQQLRLLFQASDICDLADAAMSELDVLSNYLSAEAIGELKGALKRMDKLDLKDIESSFENYDDVYHLDTSLDALSENQRKLWSLAANKVPQNRKIKNAKEEWKDAVYGSVLHAVIRTEELKRPILKELSWGAYSKKIAELRSKLEWKGKMTPYMLLAKHNEMIAYNQKELRNMDKTHRRHLRRFVEEHMGNSLLEVFPCWLCTPEAVSRVFPLNKHLFDLVIFDEASQCRIEHALPAIYRGERLVVAGDHKQLPPYDLFEINPTLDDYDEEEDEEPGVKSLLEIAQGNFEGLLLRWHYRSKYEELINFSNHAFYRGELQVSPNAERNVKALEYINVHGKWVDRKNEKEAKKVVELLDKLLRDEPKQTYGVITFNITQKELIEDEIEAKSLSDPEFRSLIMRQNSKDEKDENKGLFVKNIETVQGDERDIIIFSIGYAPDENNRFVARFGSLSRAGGEKRLNVAVSRAKKKVYVVASLEPGEFVVAGTKNEGPKKLHDYLEYSKLISEKKFEDAKMLLYKLSNTQPETQIKTQKPFESDLEDEICKSIEDMGYDVQTQVGCSKYRVDLAVLHPKNKGRYILGVECDGEQYHSSRTARERDIYRQRFLEMHEWRIFRVKSRDWWDDKKKVLRDLKNELEKSGKSV